MAAGGRFWVQNWQLARVEYAQAAIKSVATAEENVSVHLAATAASHSTPPLHAEY